ncbi:hypothetical protein Plec18170_004215 [Paecilomyces lecythidis]
MCLPALSKPAIVIAILFTVSQGAAIHPQNDRIKCRKTEVAVLGAGISSITAAQALANASVDDFVIVERNDHNVSRLWFTGETNSAEYFGFTHGAWFEGQDMGSRVAALVNGTGSGMVRYDNLHPWLHSMATTGGIIELSVRNQKHKSRGDGSTSVEQCSFGETI